VHVNSAAHVDAQTLTVYNRGEDEKVANQQTIPHKIVLSLFSHFFGKLQANLLTGLLTKLFEQ